MEPKIRKNGIPASGEIMMESGPEQWSELSLGKLSEFNTSGIIETADGSRVRIRLKIKQAYILDSVSVSSYESIESEDSDASLSPILVRIYNILSSRLERDSWMLVGVVKGARLPKIVVKYIPTMQLTLYGIELEEDSEKNDFDPSLN